MRKLIAALVGILLLCQPVCANSEKPIRIGVLSDFQGIFNDLGGRGSQIAAQLAVDEFGGKILGRPVEVLIADHQNKPDVGAATARRWYEVDGVEMITDVIGSSVALAVQSVARRQKKVAMYSGAGAEDLWGKSCYSGGFVWSLNTYSMATVAGEAMVDDGADSWFIISQDSVFGKTLETNLTDVLKRKGATVVGVTHFPITNYDFASHLLSAQSSKAKVIALTAGDLPSAMKQAKEFGILDGGQRVTSLMVWLPMVKSAGLEIARGLYVTSSFYWDLTDDSRSWANKFYERAGFMPSMTHAGSYSATKHYLKAVQAAETVDSEVVIPMMRRMPVEDATARGMIRPDGLLARDFYLFQVKAPSESKSPWDLYRHVRTIKAEVAVPSIEKSGCPIAHP